MKILMLSDLHARDTNPRSRIDNYYQTQFEKLEYILTLAKKEEAIILQAGDWFDNVRSSYKLISDTINLLKKYSLSVWCISGNHDQRYHTKDLSNTPIKVLEEAGVVKFLGVKGIPYLDTAIYGCHYGEGIPEPEHDDMLNILVIHKMVIPSADEKIWFGQTNYVTAKTLLAKNKYDVILAGDNHGFFVEEHNGKVLFNLGSIMRSNTKQLKHQPRCAIYDTEKRSYKIYDIPVKLSSEVFDLEEIEKAKNQKEDSQLIKDYVKMLAGGDKGEWNFVSNLNNFIDKNNVRSSVANIIKSTLEN